MSDQIARYTLCIIPVLIGAWDIGNAAKCFEEGKYFTAGMNLMMAVYMICLFVMTFFDL